MSGYVDPFAKRSSRQEAGDDGSEPSSDDAVTVVDDDEHLDERDDDVDLIGLDAMVDAAERGRREAPSRAARRIG